MTDDDSAAAQVSLPGLQQAMEARDASAIIAAMQRVRPQEAALMLPAAQLLAELLAAPASPVTVVWHCLQAPRSLQHFHLLSLFKNEPQKGLWAPLKTVEQLALLSTHCVNACSVRQCAATDKTCYLPQLYFRISSL